MPFFPPPISGSGATEAMTSNNHDQTVKLMNFNTSLCSGVTRLYFAFLLFESMQRRNLEFIASLGIEIPDQDEFVKRAARQHYAILAARDFILCSWSINYLCRQVVRDDFGLFRTETRPAQCIREFVADIDRKHPKLKNLRDAVAHSMEFPERPDRHSLSKTNKKSSLVISGGGRILISDGIYDNGYCATYKGEHLKMSVDKYNFELFHQFYQRYCREIE